MNLPLVSPRFLYNMQVHRATSRIYVPHIHDAHPSPLQFMSKAEMGKALGKHRGLHDTGFQCGLHSWFPYPERTWWKTSLSHKWAFSMSWLISAHFEEPYLLQCVHCWQTCFFGKGWAMFSWQSRFTLLKAGSPSEWSPSWPAALENHRWKHRYQSFQRLTSDFPKISPAALKPPGSAHLFKTMDAILSGCLPLAVCCALGALAMLSEPLKTNYYISTILHFGL